MHGSRVRERIVFGDVDELDEVEGTSLVSGVRTSVFIPVS